MTPTNRIPTALAHLDAAESAAHADDDLLLAADIRYSRTTLTLTSGTSDAVPAVAATDAMTHLKSAAAALDEHVDLEPTTANDLLTARAEIGALLQRGHP